MPTTSPFALSHLPQLGPQTKTICQSHSLLIWEDKPSPLLGYFVVFEIPTSRNQRSISDPQVRKTPDWAQMLGDKGIGVEMTSSVWVPRGQGYRSCLSKPAVHTREPGNRDHEGKSRVFSTEATKTGLYTQASHPRVRREGGTDRKRTDKVRS